MKLIRLTNEFGYGIYIDPADIKAVSQEVNEILRNFYTVVYTPDRVYKVQESAETIANDISSEII